MMARRWTILLRQSLGGRWFAWFATVSLMALIGLFPLRAALGMSDLQRIGFAARQVAGSIWYGRIGELHLRSQPLGTFEVKLEPTALLLGDVSMAFSRMDHPEGVLRGRLVAGLKRGIVGTSGRLALGDMFAPLPIEAIELSDVTLLFRGGTCVKASGQVAPIIDGPIAGAFAGLNGRLQCDGERARVVLQGQSGNERFEFYVHANGSYRAWMSVRSAAPEINSPLAEFGFRPTPQGMTLSVDGRL